VHDRRRKGLIAASLALVLATGAAATCQGIAYWRSLDLAHSPLERLWARTAPAAPRLARRVVLVILDGLRADRADDLPALAVLRQHGASRTLFASFPTLSIPQYWALLSGVDPEASGARTNGYRHVPCPLDNVIRDASEAGLSVAALGPAAESWYPPALGSLFRFAGFGDGYRQVLARALDSAADLTIVIEDEIDQAGHQGDGGGPSYRAAARVADRELGALAARLDLSKDALIVTADHGHVDDGGHGGDEPQVLAVPLVAAGAGIRPGRFEGAHLVDIAPTLAVLLGLPTPAASRGRPLVEMLALSPEAMRTLVARDGVRRASVERLLRRALGSARTQDALQRALRIAAAGLLGALLALGIRRAGAGWRDLGLAGLYLGAFVLAFHLAGGRVSLSAARTGGFFARVLVIAFLAAGTAWFLLARRIRHHPPALLLSTAALAGAPWLVSLAVVGLHGGLVLPAPTWTALGAWAGIPLICFGPWALASAILALLTRPAPDGLS
jgi:hypothetical protein